MSSVLCKHRGYYQSLKIPDKATSITQSEAEYINNFLKRNKLKKTLEVGLAYGCSTAYIISATRHIHYVIDPSQETAHAHLGLKNIETLGLQKYLRFSNDFSHNVLPELLRKNVKVDFAFIDGGHKFDDIFIDFYYVDLMLNARGHILFHDSWMRSTQHVISWIRNNKKNYRILETPMKNLVLVQKMRKENREWYHFKSFGTMKSLFSQLLFTVRHR